MAQICSQTVIFVFLGKLFSVAPHCRLNVSIIHTNHFKLPGCLLLYQKGHDVGSEGPKNDVKLLIRLKKEDHRQVLAIGPRVNRMTGVWA
jgi:hypothetical protein